DIRVAARDRDLGPCTRLAGRGDDAHDALVDLRNLHLEELHEKPDVGPRQDDLRPARLPIDVLEVRDDAVARSVALSGSLLLRRRHGFDVASEVDDDVVAALEPSHDARDDLAFAVLELVEHALALGVPYALDDHLLRRLRGNPPEAPAM